MEKFFSSLKQTVVNGTTWGTLGLAGLVATAASAQNPPNGIDVSNLPASNVMWLYIATMVLQFGFETVKLLLTRSDDKKTEQGKKK